jgi:ribonuclease M5
MQKIRLKETIVVEGKDDVSAVKAVVEADIITTSGLGLNDQIIKEIKMAASTTGLIVLTDPDFPGNKIRQMLNDLIPNLKHAHIARNKATKNGNVGVENARPEDILDALLNAQATQVTSTVLFSEIDLYKNGLSGTAAASKRRRELAEKLHIGYCSAKQFLIRLNQYGITRDAFEDALKKMEEMDG